MLMIIDRVEGFVSTEFRQVLEVDQNHQPEELIGHQILNFVAQLQTDSWMEKGREGNGMSPEQKYHVLEQ